MASQPPVRPQDVGIGRLFEHIREAVVVADTDTGLIVLWNPAAERILGYSAAEVLHRPVAEVVVPGRLRQRYAAHITRYRRTGRGAIIDAPEPVELPARTKSGTEITIELSLTRIEEAAVPGRFVLAVIRDVTERKRAELERARVAREEAARVEAARAARERERFLIALSHDLQNPLVGILAQVQLLRRRVMRAAGPVEQQRVLDGLDEVGTAATRMANLINELLEVARQHGGESLALHRGPTDLVALAQAAAAEHQARSPQHAIQVEATEHHLIGDWDAARLERVLGNLLGNAIKYSPAGTRITVVVRREEDASGPWAVLAIRDEGLGIPAADLPYIFEPFRRGANVVGRAPGTGIGLAGARQIVEQHGGSLRVESREGSGSTFIVRLPLGADVEAGSDDGLASPAMVLRYADEVAQETGGQAGRVCADLARPFRCFLKSAALVLGNPVVQEMPAGSQRKQRNVREVRSERAAE